MLWDARVLNVEYFHFTTLGNEGLRLFNHFSPPLGHYIVYMGDSVVISHGNLGLFLGA